MNIFSSLLISSIAGLSTCLGSLITFLNINENNINKYITFSLSLSIAVMIGISVFDLIPSSFLNLYYTYYSSLPILKIIISFLFGIALVLLINKIIISRDYLYKLGILSMIALMIHNFPEGIATFLGSVTSTSLGFRLSFAIMLHNIPEGISIAMPIYCATKSRKKAFFKTFISGVSEPLGALFAYIFLANSNINNILDYILIMVSGIMITLSIEEIFPEVIRYNIKKYMYIGFLIGIIIVIICVGFM